MKIEWKGNDIGSEGAESLSEAMKINTSLASLDLACDEKEMKWKKTDRRNENERNE